MIFNNVDFQLLLTQILHLNLKRVKIASNDMEYLDKVPGVKNQSVFKEAYVRGYSIKNFDYPEKPLKYKHIRRISD